MTIARLSYMSLEGVGNWDNALKEVGPQLRPYQDYLRTAIEAAKRRKLVLGWRPSTEAERTEFERRRRLRAERRAQRESDSQVPTDLPRGHWIVLEPAPGREEEPEATFDQFLEARALFEDERCGADFRLAKLDFDREGRALMLEALPEAEDPKAERLVWLDAEKYQLERQLHALLDLESAPAPRHAPLIKLACTRSTWPMVVPETVDKWVFLKAQKGRRRVRKGTAQQRQFVEMALGTRDFAVLDGPPGSGKTTAICELIAQLARQGKRVLLVASTHVAVDNVLERLLRWQEGESEKLLLPVRIGAEDAITKDIILPWTFQRLQRTWQARLREFLRRPVGGNPGARAARLILQEALSKPENHEESALTRLLVDSSNLVCGTTIGILQHPAIRAARHGAIFEPFDVMILDEASKTTLTEFLVPARHAAKWVISGDLRQLSPFVNEADLSDNLRGLLPAGVGRACVHAFLAKRRRAVLAVSTEDERSVVRQEAEGRGVRLLDLDAATPREVKGVRGVIPDLLHAQLIIGSAVALRAHEHRLPEDTLEAGGSVPELPSWNAARRAYESRTGDRIAEESPDWAEHVAWRLVRSYELRFSPAERARYLNEVEELLPRTLDERWFEWRRMRPRTQREGPPETPLEALRRDLESIRRAALPSILELLQRGFERLKGWTNDVPLTAGLPPLAAQQRVVSLSYQHRMHPEISAFPREKFYAQDGDTRALLLDGGAAETDGDAPDLSVENDGRAMKAEREWAYNRYARRALWIDLNPGTRRGTGRNTNPVEAARLLSEVETFAKWAASNPRADGEPWEVAALTFYRGQEKLLRQELQRLSDQHGNSRTFHLPRGTRAVELTLCTVDRFQGHESDIVFLSFVKSGSVGFLNSPNRLNVALTRARYQLVLLGHRSYFANCRRSPLLEALAKSNHYAGEIGWEVTS